MCLSVRRSCVCTARVRLCRRKKENRNTVNYSYNSRQELKSNGKMERETPTTTLEKRTGERSQTIFSNRTMVN